MTWGIDKECLGPNGAFCREWSRWPRLAPVLLAQATKDPSVSQGTEGVSWSKLLFMEGPEFDAMYRAHLPPGMEGMEP